MSKNTRILVTLFGGWFGLHKFLDKKIGTGILYFCTAGLFLVGWIHDCIKVFKMPDMPIENICIQRLMPKCKEWNIDTIFITTRKKCPFCSKYNRKIYSLYGWNKKYPKMPNVLLNAKCPECQNSIGASIYFSDINTPPE